MYQKFHKTCHNATAAFINDIRIEGKQKVISNYYGESCYIPERGTE
jgi:hypothetical protein